MTETRIMSGSELKVALGGLGLPPGWFADQRKVTMRTVVRWFDSAEVAPEVAEHVAALSRTTLDEMMEILNEIDDDADPVVLKTYRTDDEFVQESPAWPASWHRALTFRITEHLRAQGRDVTIEYR